MAPVSFEVFSWAVSLLVLVLIGLIRAVQVLNRRINRRKDELAEYKLDVSEKYVSVGHLKEVEERITGHLTKIENKLDGMGP